MATFTYELSYAGIPLHSDVSKIVRINARQPEQINPKTVAPRKFQPEADFQDELNRVIPFQYLQDFSPPLSYPGRNLDGLAGTNNEHKNPSTAVRIGDWFYPIGASRWSVFRGLATSSMVKAILGNIQLANANFQTAQLGWGSALFRMKAFPDSPYATTLDNQLNHYTLESRMYMLPPRPLGEAGIPNAFLQTPYTLDGLYLITLVDERYYWQYQTSTIHITEQTQWIDILEQLAASLNIDNFGVTFNFSNIDLLQYKPQADSPLWSNRENAANLLDAAAANLGRTIVRALDGTYTMQTFEEANSIAERNRSRLFPATSPFNFPFSSGVLWSGSPSPTEVKPVERIAGGDIFTSGAGLPIGGINAFINNELGEQEVGLGLLPARNAIVPSQVTVSYPLYVYKDDPVPHFVNSRYPNQRPSAWYEDSYGEVYTVTVPITSGGLIVSGLPGVSGFTGVVKSTAKALISGEADVETLYDIDPDTLEYTDPPVNYPGLLFLAMQTARNYYGTQLGQAYDEVYPGTMAWQPEGQHDIVWTYSERSRLASTRVMSQEWNLLLKDLQQATPISQDPNFPPPYPFIDAETTTPRGVGGKSVALNVRDSYSGSLINGVPNALLMGDISATATSVTISDASYFPTQNNFRARIGGFEVVLCRGTNGSTGIQILYRGIDGTQATPHLLADTFEMIVPDKNYGTNLITVEKNQFLYPSDWTSGGIQGLNLVPQIQTVRAMGDNTTINGVLNWNGTVQSYDPTIVAGAPQLQFIQNEDAWLIERNNQIVLSGMYFAGQFANFSADPIKPVYLINAFCYCSGVSVSGGAQFLQNEDIWLVERNNQPIISGNFMEGQLAGYTAEPVKPVYLVNNNCYCGGLSKCSGLPDRMDYTVIRVSGACATACVDFIPPGVPPCIILTPPTIFTNSVGNPVLWTNVQVPPGFPSFDIFCSGTTSVTGFQGFFNTLLELFCIGDLGMVLKATYGTGGVTTPGSEFGITVENNFPPPNTVYPLHLEFPVPTPNGDHSLCCKGGYTVVIDGIYCRIGHPGDNVGSVILTPFDPSTCPCLDLSPVTLTWNAGQQAYIGISNMGCNGQFINWKFYQIGSQNFCRELRLDVISGPLTNGINQIGIVVTQGADPDNECACPPLDVIFLIRSPLGAGVDSGTPGHCDGSEGFFWVRIQE